MIPFIFAAAFIVQPSSDIQVVDRELFSLPISGVKDQFIHVWVKSEEQIEVTGNSEKDEADARWQADHADRGMYQLLLNTVDMRSGKSRGILGGYEYSKIRYLYHVYNERDNTVRVYFQVDLQGAREQHWKLERAWGKPVKPLGSKAKIWIKNWSDPKKPVQAVTIRVVE